MEPKIGFVAPSSAVPRTEFAVGALRLKERGISYLVHPSVFGRHRYWSGTDEARAQAVFEYAKNSKVEVLWTARGGYGAFRLLSHLDRLTKQEGKPPRDKLLVGYSDATALMDYVRTRWGWSTLHAPIPGLRAFSRHTEREIDATLAWIDRDVPDCPWEKKKLKPHGIPLAHPIEGVLVGGNLSVWLSLYGTEYAPQTKFKNESTILFLEDTDEPLYRLDRMVQHLAHAGGLAHVKAIVLGTFQNCRDSVMSVLKKAPARWDSKTVMAPSPSQLVALRKGLAPEREIIQIFRDVADSRGIPVFSGLPVGHGPSHFALPLGSRVKLASNGSFKIKQWDWLGLG